MSNNLKTIKLNLWRLFWKYPHLKNSNYNQVVAFYWREFHNFEISSEIIKILPSVESISRQRRKLAETHQEFRPDKKEVIESRINQTEKILEECRESWPYE